LNQYSIIVSNKHTHVFLFVTEFFWVFIQTRRLDFAAGGTKTTRGKHFLNTILDVCSNLGAKHEMRAQILNGGARHHWPPADDDPFLLYEYFFGVQSELI